MILVYTHKITPRVRYIFKHIFTRILLIPVNFTTKIEEFVSHNGPKMSYTKTPLANEFFVKSNQLLFEQGVDDIDINIQTWQDSPCFFGVGSKCSIPFDIFAASFYLVTRYEEYLPHVKDAHGRFKATDSLAFKHNFLEQPVVDIWAHKLLAILKEAFPDYKYQTKSYQFISTVDIDNVFAYKHKGFIRSFGGFALDVVKFRVVNFWYRLAVILNIKKDPYAVFDTILNLKKKDNFNLIFFCSVGGYSSFDTNVSPFKRAYKLLIKNLVDYTKVGVHPSYFSMTDSALLKKEKERLEAIINKPVLRSRQHYLRFNLPETYQHLIDLEIAEDHSMGYATHTGFRASTCTPFYFYDLEFEIQTPLKVFPFAVMDTCLKNSLNITPKQSLGKIRDLKNEVKAVNGTFITLFHNESLSNHLDWQGWSRLYASMIKIGKA